MENIKPIGAVKWTLQCKKDQLAEITSKIVDWLPGNIKGTFVLALDVLNTSDSSQNLFKSCKNLVPELKKLTGVFPSSYFHFRSNHSEFTQLKDFLKEGWVEPDSFIVFMGRQAILGAWDMSGGDFKILVGQQLTYDTALSLSATLGTRLDDPD